MPATLLAAPMDAPSRKKQLDDDLDIERPTGKQAQGGSQPRLPRCPLPLGSPSAPVRALAVTAASQLGPYVLLEPQEGGRACQALHCPTGTEYTCKVPTVGAPLPEHHRGPGKGSRGLPGLMGPYIHLVLYLLGKQPVNPQVFINPWAGQITGKPDGHSQLRWSLGATGAQI